MKIQITTLILFISQLSVAQTFWKKYSGTLIDYNTWSSIPTSDGGYMIASYIFYTHPNIPHTELFTHIIKTDANGNSVWNRYLRLCDTCDIIPQEIIEIKSGGYLISSATAANYGDSVCLVKLDTSGNLVWVKFYNIQSRLSTLSTYVSETMDGGFIIHSLNYLMKLDSNGMIQWGKKHTAVYPAVFPSGKIIQTSDSGFIFMVQGLRALGLYKMGLIKCDASGNLSWIKGYADSSQHFFTNVFENSDGYIFNKGLSIIQTDFSGDTLWTKSYVLNLDSGNYNGIWFNLEASGMIMTTHGKGYIIFKSDLSGNPIWTRCDTTIENFKGLRWVHPVASGGYIINNVLPGPGGTFPMPSLLKTDAQGFFGCPVDTTQIQTFQNTVHVSTDTVSILPYSVNYSVPLLHLSDSIVIETDHCTPTTNVTNENVNTIRLYPNPSNGYFYIENIRSDSRIVITDVLGKVKSDIVSKGETALVNMTGMKGIYFCQIFYKNKWQASFKMILL